MKIFYNILLSAAFILILNNNCFAHFGMLIPSDSMVMQGDARTIDLSVSFSHPFEMVGMDMEKPAKCEMIREGKKTDLLPLLKQIKVMKRKAWKADIKINRARGLLAAYGAETLLGTG